MMQAERTDPAPSNDGPSPDDYAAAIAEFDWLWNNGQSRTAKARMNELLRIILRFEEGES